MNLKTHPSCMAERVILITGGAKRLGAEMTNLFIESGYYVLIHVRNSHAEAEHLLTEAKERHHRTCGDVLQADLSTSEGAFGLLEAVKNHSVVIENGLFGLIHNASFYQPIDVHNLQTNDMDELYGLHMRTPLLLSTGLFDHLVKGGGSIVGIIDTSWKRHWKGMTHYTATKAGLRQLLTNLAGEFAPRVRVNMIGPGAILAADWEEEHFNNVLRQVPLGRAGEPLDIAKATLHFLQTSHLCGEFLAVDGGWDLNMNQ